MYTPRQKRLIARELARAGGNIRAAARALRTEYETFDKIGEATIRRMREEEAFEKIYDDESRRLKAIEEDAAQAKEEVRAREELTSSRGRDLDILKKVQEQVLPRLQNLKDSTLVELYTRLLREIERIRQKPRPEPAASRKAAPLDGPTLEDL
ncbi:MAG: hypothetical protein KIS92_00950 [Planctomycetota bacterium]|nr:hypothetical protein [Planctomycetota bacterium]